MQRVAKYATLDCSRADKPQLLNPNIVDNTTTTDEKILTAEHRAACYEYYLEQVVNHYGVATIIVTTKHQYLTKKHEDYVGSANETMRSIIEQLETHSIILNEEKLEIMAAFFALWSDAPDMNLRDYARTLDKRQRVAKTFTVNISDEDKTTHFVTARSNPSCSRTSGRRSGSPH